MISHSSPPLPLQNSLVDKEKNDGENEHLSESKLKIMTFFKHTYSIYES